MTVLTLLKSVIELQREKLKLNEGVKSSSSVSKRLYGSLRVQTADGEKLVDNLRQIAFKSELEDRQKTLITEEIFLRIEDTLKGRQRIDYDEFTAIANGLPKEANRFFRAQVFLHFVQDENCSINTEDFLRFVQRSVDVESMLLQLSSFSTQAHDTGLITEAEMESFMLKLIPQIPILRDMHESFKPFYAITACRRFFFLLDMRRRGETALRTLCASSPMEELMFLKRVTRFTKGVGENHGIGGLPDEIQEQLSANWFYPDNALKQYRTYLNLDRDQQGSLTRADILEFQGDNGGLQLSYLTVDRLFEECQIYCASDDGGRSERGMDYTGFLDLILAVEHRESFQGVGYFWRILDIERTGKLTPTTIIQFYRSIKVALEEHGYGAPSEDDVVQEVYDMIGLPLGTPITQQHLIRSSQGPVIVAMLTDAISFWCYDNRESIVQNSES
jgi:Ca2+-binding EF-hand superfamily protein